MHFLFSLGFFCIPKQLLTREILQSIETFLSQKCPDLGMRQTRKLRPVKAFFPIYLYLEL